MSLNIQDLKNSLRIDGDQDNVLLKRYLDAATSYVKGAVGDEADVPGFYDDVRVINNFETAVISLAGTYWTYRQSISSVSAVPIDLVLNSIIGQLRGEYDERLERVMKNDQGH
ncbi:head-tail connector protein [Lactiplantibacillus plantarum]|uniref:head-tail connector protein n=1 Tax=Lactiplantibacillus plantarum TaxID=1590 RepID=UPI00223F1C49|nr:head-tail connector protein [Lactiplantibacillus plantarum]